jgi:hypothetical protein
MKLSGSAVGYKHLLPPNHLLPPSPNALIIS